MKSDERRCPVCAETIKRQAVKCRFCAADLPVEPATSSFLDPPNTQAVGCAALVALALFVLAGGQCSEDTPAPPKDPAIEAEQRRTGQHCAEDISSEYSKAGRALRNRMRDPDSFDVIDARIAPVDADGYHKAMITYRSRNGFGGMNTGVAVLKVKQEDCSFTIEALADQ